MPPVRQSSRNRQAVLPYQAADGPKLTLQQLRRRRQKGEDRKKEAQKKEQLEKVLLSIIRKKKDEEENNEEATEIQTTENELTVVLSVPGIPKKLKLTYVVDSAMSQEIHEIATKAINN